MGHGRKRTAGWRQRIGIASIGALGVLGLGACEPTVDEALMTAQVTEETNRALARRIFLGLLNNNEFQIFDEIYAPDFTKHVDGRTYTLAEEREQARGMYETMPDLVFTLDAVIAEGDKVSILYTARGHMTGPFASLPATGKPVDLTGSTIYRFRDGKVVEEWTVYNMLEILRQMGYPPT